MKIRIKGNSIRLRLAKAEVEKLSKNQIISESTRFSPAQDDSFMYRLVPIVGSNLICASLEDKKININIPEAILLKWANTGQISLEANQPIGNDEELYILVEKDFKCLTDRPNEDESDLYTHPSSETLKC